jgi:hypothetical protein
VGSAGTVPPGDGVSNQCDQLFDAHIRSGHEIVGSSLECGSRRLNRSTSREEDHGNVGPRPYAAQQVESIAPGHHHVGDDDVGGGFAESLPAGDSVGSLDHFEAGILELAGERPSRQLLVVDQENGPLHERLLFGHDIGVRST